MSNQLAKSGGTLKTILSSDAMQDQFSKALPKHLSPERFTRIAITALTRIPKLQDCTQESFFKCLLDLSAMGLEPDGRRAHLIPFNNRKLGIVECTLIVDFKGIVELMRRAGGVATIHADVVCGNDIFVHNLGTIETHSYDLRNPRGAMFAAYCQVTFKDGSKQSAIMAKSEIDGIRNRSRAGKSGPWVSDYDEMAKKTTVRRVSKMVTLSPEIMDAIEQADRSEFGDMRNVSRPAEERKALPQTNPFQSPSGRRETSEENEPLSAEVESEASSRAASSDGGSTPKKERPEGKVIRATFMEKSTKMGTTGDRKWTKYGFKLSLGNGVFWAGTFSGSIGNLGFRDGEEVNVIVKKKGDNHDLLWIESAESGEEVA